jgi:hypothetical protein
MVGKMNIIQMRKRNIVKNMRRSRNNQGGYLNLLSKRSMIIGHRIRHCLSSTMKQI